MDKVEIEGYNRVPISSATYARRRSHSISLHIDICLLSSTLLIDVSWVAAAFSPLLAPTVEVASQSFTLMSPTDDHLL